MACENCKKKDLTTIPDEMAKDGLKWLEMA